MLRMKNVILCLSAVWSLAVGGSARDWGASPEVARDMGEDWAFAPSPESFEQLKEKRTEFPCSKLGEYVAANDPIAAFYAMRDAGIFRDSNCSKSIEPLRSALQRNPRASLALHFYDARMGGTQDLKDLLEIFDKEAMLSPKGPSTDHIVVSLFGFFSDWDQTGRRLIRHHKYADGASATMSSYALQWKKHLYGGRSTYKTRCAEAAKLEDDKSAGDSYICDPLKSPGQ